MKQLYINFPLITTSPTIAALFSIITNQSFSQNWIVNHFNNLLYIESNNENRCIFLEDQPSNRETIFSELNFFRYNRLKYDIVDLLCENIIDFLRKLLDADYYIRITLDNYYLSLNSINYKKNHVYHPLLIFGYDDEKEVFCIGEFFDGKKFSFYTISYNEVQTAYNYKFYLPSETEEYLENIIFVKIDWNYEAEKIDIIKIIEETKDYLSGTENSNKYKYRIRKKESSYTYGINCYNKLIQSIKESCFDIRSAHVFYDRMKLHSCKIDILFKRNILNNQSYIYLKEASQYLEALSLQCRNLCIKYMLKYNRDIPANAVKKMEDAYLKLQEAEQFFLFDFMEVFNGKYFIKQ